MINALKKPARARLKLLLHNLRRYRANGALTQLASSPNPKLKAIGIALQDSLAQNLSRQEREVIRLIERRRCSLLDSDRDIPVIDYGAGSSNSRRTNEQMEGGVQSTALVATIAKASKPQLWATILFKMIRNLKPISCVELGSCVGISSSYQAAALNINGKGRIVTHEGSPEIANIAKETLESLGLDNATVVTGPFHHTLKASLEKFKPVDFFFNDGHHDQSAVMRYFNESIPHLSEGAVVVVDDITWSAGMKEAWAEIERHERVSVAINLRTIGIALVNSSYEDKVNLKIPL